MNIYVSSLRLTGVESIGESALPVFRSLPHDKPALSNGTMPPDTLEGFGRNTADRVLPYLMQDRYSRDKKPVTIKTIVMDNGVLRATFAPDFGGKLYSLVDLRSGRELLFSNPVLQPGNLAIRTAWLSGGVEWNIGQFGHTFTTCSPMFFVRMTAPGGEPFLRMFEYERQKKLFWQVDFHLPAGSAFLQAHVRIVNDSDAAVPMYWWTNTACAESEDTRIFSSCGEVLYHDRHATKQWLEQHGVEDTRDFGKAPLIFGYTSLPWLEFDIHRNVADVSYPHRLKNSFEYFFQTPADVPAPWEAATGSDGLIVFERSTMPLRYRKMFCWGKAGRLWCDYLSQKGKGDYVEIQAGLAPSQAHGMQMPGGSTIEFTQLFGCAVAPEPARMYAEWDESRGYVEAVLNGALPPDEIRQADERCRLLASAQPLQADFLHNGSGWGALEAVRRKMAKEAPVPAGFLFPESSLGPLQAPWLALLENGWLAPLAEDRLPAAYVTDPAWQPLLENSLNTEQGNNSTAANCLAALLCENGDRQKAAELWKLADSRQPDSLARRNLAYIAKQAGDSAAARMWMQKAYELEQGRLDPGFAEEYMRLLLENGEFKAVWAVYAGAPAAVRGSSLAQTLAAQAAIEIGEYDFLDMFFQKEQPVIREGATLLSDLWFRRQAQLLAEQRGIPCDEALLNEVTRTLNPPENLDFRMSE